MTPGNRSSIVGAIDCHAHVFVMRTILTRTIRFTTAAEPEGYGRDILATLDAHGLTHGLVIGAQPYGSDNRCMLDAIAESADA